MVDALNVGIALDLITSVFFLYISYRVAQLALGDHPMAKVLHRSQWFWLGTSSFMLLDGGFALWVLSSNPGPPVPLLVLAVRRGLFVIGLAGLTYLLANIGYNMRRWMPYFIAYWAFMLLAVEAITLYANPLGYRIDTWNIELVASQQTHPLLNFAYGVLLFAPPLLLAFSNLRLYRHMPNREAKFRLMALLLSVQSFGTGIIVGFWDNDWFWYGLFENRLAFSVATGMLFALRPPWIVRIIWKIPRLQSAANFPGRHLIPPRK